MQDSPLAVGDALLHLVERIREHSELVLARNFHGFVVAATGDAPGRRGLSPERLRDAAGNETRRGERD